MRKVAVNDKVLLLLFRFLNKRLELAGKLLFINKIRLSFLVIALIEMLFFNKIRQINVMIAFPSILLCKRGFASTNRTRDDDNVRFFVGFFHGKLVVD